LRGALTRAGRAAGGHDPWLARVRDRVPQGHRAAVAAAIGARQPAGCIGIHLNGIGWDPDEREIASAGAPERELIRRRERFASDLSGYSKAQDTRPQTIGYALADSPAGQAAWIYEKFHDWTDHNGTPESILTMDEMLDDIMMYWVTNTSASSARRYWEDVRDTSYDLPVAVPAAPSMFPRDIEGPSRRWAGRRFSQIVRWSEPGRGGHFAALEQPALFVEEVRAGLRAIRQSLTG
jgi:pimeloyl-ACP methyl ester carboxylesterase